VTSPPIKTKPSIVLAGLLFSFFLYLLIILVKTKFFSQPVTADVLDAGSFFYSRLILWLYLLIIYAYVIKIEKQQFLLWSERKSSVVFYIISVVVLLVAVVIVVGILSKIETYYGWNNSDKLKAMLKLLWKNKWLLLFTTLSAGIMEELLFRGYLIPRLQLFLKKSWLAVVVSSLLFGLAHYSYGSLSQMINPLIIGLIFGYHYQKYRNIKVLILCHFLIDFISILTTH
jgi:membrane protease YdiL (CAAX protease family)